jgi:hypothetical protein
MGLEKPADNVTLQTDGTTITLNEISSTTSVNNTVTTALKEDTKTENLILNLQPLIIDSIELDNQTDLSNLGDPGDKVLLVGQDTESENGYYIQGSGKQTLNENRFFIDSSEKTGVYNYDVHNGTDTFTRVFFHNISLWFVKPETTSTVQFDTVDIPVRQDKPCMVEAEVMGYRTSDYSISFLGSYRKTIYYDGTTYHDGGSMEKRLKRTDATFAFPEVTFAINGSERKIKITPGDSTATKWFVKGHVSF